LISVYINFAYLYAIAIFVCNFVEDRGNHLARATPFCPVINQYGLVGVDDVCIKGVVACMYDAAHVNVSKNIQARSLPPCCVIMYYTFSG
jgi:hypothetical protein